MNLTFGEAQIYTSERMVKFPKLSKAFFKIFGYTNLGNYARFTVFKKLVDQVPMPKNAQILDLGTGYGEYAFSLSKALPSGQIHALDIDPERIYILRQAIRKSLTSNIRTYADHLKNVYLPELDFAFSIDVFEHIGEDQMPFQEVYDRLKPGGYFLVKIPNRDQKTIFPESWFEEHQDWLEEEHIGQVYELQGLKNRFEKEGFEVVHASYSDGWLSRMGWELAYLGKKAGFLGQLLSLPFAKGLVKLDRVFHQNTWGNAIQVIGKKPE
ncbi:class I SAM-dependent methyltransferase [Algoriphagus kandeliae]|uniref:Class I SAM-dependent methyltransferase n=1 Tax=Algoriphagus kandeliae TaxID=2562278 RepID=A0A4Y9QWQ0_9BACT|nr:class I SAM-dependent methyltransferase [Algoriphagus kandeliae]TFV95583.1 class I SAM-dependent methyltransferase [Algoriphagus kandeliae]